MSEVYQQGGGYGLKTMQTLSDRLRFAVCIGQAFRARYFVWGYDSFWKTAIECS